MFSFGRTSFFLLFLLLKKETIFRRFFYEKGKNILNIDFVKVLGFLGAGLSIAATAVSGIAQKKSMHETIEKEVAEAIKNRQ